ncbi:XF1762 family protein [Streptomyces sp. NPDC091278]|uniref:XF1762 family protein n=1 Tax=Streptomyces sp. NPDC091278 TaxID=3155301 RepID=UPI00345015CC
MQREGPRHKRKGICTVRQLGGRRSLSRRSKMPPAMTLPSALGQSGEAPRLHLVPVRQKDAKAFVAAWHRHHRPPPGCVFVIGAGDERGVLRAVAMVGRPVARAFDNGQTLEVTRTATDGTANANSLLYGAAWRAAKALGYVRLITYTQAGESGASLRGAGWRIVAERAPRRGWDTPSRPRLSQGVDQVARTLWEAPRQLGEVEGFDDSHQGAVELSRHHTV